jgi:hypothetical protein
MNGEPPKLESDTPLCPVSAEDLKRVCQLIQKARALAPRTTPEGEPLSLGIDHRAVAAECGPDADPQSVFFRAALLLQLSELGLFDEWRDGDDLANRVFEAAAAFPMEQGVQGFDPDRFIETLRTP